MAAFFRMVFVLLWAGGGAYGAFYLLGLVVQRAGGGEFHMNSEALLLVVPVCVVGALLGALVGGVLVPRPSN